MSEQELDPEAEREIEEEVRRTLINSGSSFVWLRADRYKNALREQRLKGRAEDCRVSHTVETQLINALHAKFEAAEAREKAALAEEAWLEAYEAEMRWARNLVRLRL